MNLEGLITVRQGNEKIGGREFGFGSPLSSRQPGEPDDNRVYTGRTVRSRPDFKESPLANRQYYVPSGMVGEEKYREHLHAVAAYKPWLDRQMELARQGHSNSAFTEVDMLADLVLYKESLRQKGEAVQPVTLTCWCEKGYPCHAGAVREVVLERAIEKSANMKLGSKVTGIEGRASQSIDRDGDIEWLSVVTWGRNYHLETDADTLTVVFAGSRPQSFTQEELADVKLLLQEMVDSSFKRAENLGMNKVRFISGMARGVDQIAATEVLKYFDDGRHGNLEVELVAAIPCKSLDSVWSAADKRQYQDILSRCDRIHYVSDDVYHSPKQLFERNEWMIDQMQGGADLLMAVQANNSRGTQGAIDYTIRAGKTVIKYDADAREYSKIGGQEVRDIGMVKERSVFEFDEKVKGRGFEL